MTFRERNGGNRQTCALIANALLTWSLPFQCLRLPILPEATQVNSRVRDSQWKNLTLRGRKRVRHFLLARAISRKDHHCIVCRWLWGKIHSHKSPSWSRLYEWLTWIVSHDWTEQGVHLNDRKRNIHPPDNHNLYVLLSDRTADTGSRDKTNTLDQPWYSRLARRSQTPSMPHIPGAIQSAPERQVTWWTGSSQNITRSGEIQISRY